MKCTLESITINIVDGVHGDCEPQDDSGYYFISVKDMDGDHIKYDGARQITHEAYRNAHKRTRLESGDVLFANTGDTIGKMLLATPESVRLGQTTFQKSIALLKPNLDFVTVNYFYYVIMSNRLLLKKAAVGSGQKNLLLSDMRPFVVEIINDKGKQEEIVRYVKAIDCKITLNNAINAELENAAKLLYDYWFVQFDFPNAEDKPYRASGGEMVYNEQLMRDVPKGWKVKPLGNVLGEVESGKRPQGGAVQSGIPSIGAENIESFGVYDYSKEKYISPSHFARMRSGVVKSGDVLLYKDGAYAGKASMALDGFPHPQCAVNEHVFILRFGDELPSQFFLYLFLRRPEIYNKINSIASSKAAQPGLNQDELNSVYVVVPPKEIVRLFNQRVEPMMHKIAGGANQSVELTALRDFLLPLLMNGRVRVCG